MPLSGATFGNGLFLAIQGGIILTSSDGIVWDRHFPGVFGVTAHLDVTYGSGTFVAVGTEAPFMLPHYQILTSTDGIAWTSRAIGDGVLSGIAYGNGTFVTVGWNGTIKQSGSLCSATLDPNLSIHVPNLIFAGTPFRADLAYVPDTLTFDLVDYGLLTDTSAYEGCTPATLSDTFLLHIPNIMFRGASYRLDLQYTQQGTSFVYTNLGVNY